MTEGDNAVQALEVDNGSGTPRKAELFAAGDDMVPACSRTSSRNERARLVGGKGENGHKVDDDDERKPPKFVYRAEVDGLRFWAVMPVIFYHYNSMFGVTGGYAGVDVFFVISGYLITSIVIRELCSGKPVLATFWERRVRRLLPAIALMFICLYLYGWYMLAPAIYHNFVGESIYALIAGSNIYFYITTKDDGGYNTAGPEQYPLLHFWSLAVEEQFYLVLPVMLVCIWKYCKSGRQLWYTVLSCLGFVFLASFVFSVVYTPINQPFCFYMLFSRAWELAIGSFIGLGTSDKGVAAVSKVIARWFGADLTSLSPLLKRIMLECVSWSGFGLIIFVYFYYTKEIESEYPSFYALGPCAGAALVIIGNTPRYLEEEAPHHSAGDVESKPSGKDKLVPRKRRILTTNGWILSLHPFVWIGKLSYALYLWHWPIWCFKTANLNPLWLSENVSNAMLILLSLALSAISTECIERPFRSSQLVGKKTLWSVACVCWSALMAFSISVYVLNIGGASNAIEAEDMGALNNASLPFFPAPATGFEPESFFMQNADPKYFSIEGIEESNKPHYNISDVEKVSERVYLCEANGKYHVTSDEETSDFSAAEVGFDCPKWAKWNKDEPRTIETFYNSARDPPCVTLIGNSHMAGHEATVVNLAREYNVSVNFLLRMGRAYFFDSPPTGWDNFRIDMLKKYEPKVVVFMPTQLYEGKNEMESLPVTFDALLSGNPDKVLIMGDHPLVGGFPLYKKTKDVIIEGIQLGSLSSWEELNRIKPDSLEKKLANEALLAKAIEDNPKYREVIDHQTVYPAFMDANGTFLQLIGVETEGGNKLLFGDRGHLSPDGSARLEEYFREHVFKDLNCTK